MTDDRIKVLYIAGVGRSGSTILGALLGQVEGLFFGGEIGALFERVAERLCGCGERLEECALWRSVFERAMGRRLDLREIYLQGRGLRGATPGGLETFLAQLYRSILTVTGSRAIVDSSKSVSYGRVLSRIPGIDLHVVHLIRDPRAVAFSWGRTKPSPRTGGYFPRKRAGRSVLEWVAYNAATEVVLGGKRVKQRRLRYEDFIAHPGETLEQLLRWLGDGAATAGVAEGRVVLRTCHTVAGNADRFHTGEVVLRCDDEWKRRMGWLARGGVSLATWPLRWRYGY
jgi:hypothetical protein